LKIQHIVTLDFNFSFVSAPQEMDVTSADSTTIHLKGKSKHNSPPNFFWLLVICGVLQNHSLNLAFLWQKSDQK